MERTYKELARLETTNDDGFMLLQALTMGLPIEFELEGDDIVIKAVTHVRPECCRRRVCPVMPRADIN